MVALHLKRINQIVIFVIKTACQLNPRFSYYFVDEKSPFFLIQVIGRHTSFAVQTTLRHQNYAFNVISSGKHVNGGYTFYIINILQQCHIPG